MPRNRPRDDDDDDDDDYEEAPRKKKKAKNRRSGRRNNQTLWLVGALTLVLWVAGTVGGLIWALSTGKTKPTTAATPDHPQPPGKSHRERFVGNWEYIPPDLPGSKMTLDVRASELTLTAIHPGSSTIVKAPWEVISDTNEQMKIQVRFTQTAEWGIDLLPNDEMRVNFLSGRSKPVVYKRVR